MLYHILGRVLLLYSSLRKNAMQMKLILRKYGGLEEFIKKHDIRFPRNDARKPRIIANANHRKMLLQI